MLGLGLPRRGRDPTGARIRKTRKIKNKGWGVICVPRAEHGIVPVCRIKG